MPYSDPQKRREASQRKYRRRMEEDPEYARRKSARWRDANLEKSRELTRKSVDKFRAVNPGRAREIAAAARDKLSSAVFGHYGSACACCGAADRLTIDHVDGDGREHRARLGNGNTWAVYAWLIKHDFPAGFQVLCRPCNASKKTGTRCRLNHEGVQR